jgi:hypothetical protein
VASRWLEVLWTPGLYNAWNYDDDDDDDYDYVDGGGGGDETEN